MKPKTKKWVKFGFRWGIAVLGIFYVLKNISLHDQVIIQDTEDGKPNYVRLYAMRDGMYTVAGMGGKEIPESDLLVRGDREKVRIQTDRGVEQLDLLGLKVDPGEPNRSRWPLLVSKPRSIWARYWNETLPEPAQLVDPSLVRESEPWRVQVEYPLIDNGLATMVGQANTTFLWAAILIFPLTFVITSYRWHLLLKVLQIRITVARSFIINMVGAFYNTFMPGSTGGDVAKAYYAAKQDPTRRTRAVMSVVVDRVIGLLALVLLGGAMAHYQYRQINNPNDATAQACLRVAIGSAVIMGATVLGLVVFYTPVLRRLTGLNWLIARLPMQQQVGKAVEVMEIYRRRPILMLVSFLLSIPVHMTVVLSAMFAGLALDLSIRPTFYWVVVPVCVLAGALPVSPQGAGVMEFFAILLTRREGASVSQAVALTMSIRLVQILWNCAGGYFVLRGHFHVPTEKEAQELNAGDGAVGGT